MAGANMSGDLKDPGKSIPRGTLSAVVVTGLIYLAMAVMLGGVASREALLANPLVVEDVALSGLLITAGVFAATLSSALGSMLGAPRILQALAQGRHVPEALRFFGQGSGRGASPGARSC